MKKNKGFTLIELLAVIVVLAIIALIATPIVLNLIDNARKGAAEQSATAYVKAVENAVVKDMLNQVNHENKVGYQYDEISVDVSGTKPTSGTYTLKDGRVETANFCISGYNIDYSNGVSIAKGKCNGDKEEVLEGDPILDKAKALVYENGSCKTDGTTYTYMGGCYIKGASTNNYVWYNGFMWRIMGINSDNTVRLITDENVTTIAYGALNTALTYATNEGYINDWLNDYFYGNLNSTKSIIKEGPYFCSETTNSTSLTTDTARTTCTSGNEVTAKVGIISIDEYLLANTSSSYLNIGPAFWTMTPDSTSNAWYVYTSGKASRSGVPAPYGVRPVINVDATSTITKGDGISSGYYVLSENKNNDKTGTLVENVTSGEYVKLEGKIYRVVSKESDGIKLILDGYYEETVAYGSNNTFTLESGIGQKLNGDVLTWLGLSDSDEIVETTWYQGDSFGNGTSYKNTLKKSNGVQAKVGLIQVGDILAGQSSTLLTKNYNATSSYSNTSNYWTMNKYSTSIWYINKDGRVYASAATNNYNIRPVIKVDTNLTILKGNGTWNNPYEV